MDNLIVTPFANIALEDPFFDSLRANYEGFDDWFRRKASAGEVALVYYDGVTLLDFLYLKDENEALPLDGITLPPKKRLKVGTFKIERRGTNRGERFMKRILDVAIIRDISEVYVTMFDDTEELQHLRSFFEQYGFSEVGRKSHANGRSESVLVRDMSVHTGDIVRDYPFVDRTQGKKYLLAIKPDYHTKLFPDSILKTEHYDILQDVSPTNSINKIYICWMRGVDQLKYGYKLIIYRTTDYQGPAHYRSVATSLCTVSEVKTIRDFANIDEFVRYTNRYGIFNETELRRWYHSKPYFVVFKVVYNLAFQKKVIRKELIEQAGLIAEDYWGFMPLTETQFTDILNLGNADGRYIVN